MRIAGAVKVQHLDRQGVEGDVVEDAQVDGQDVGDAGAPVFGGLGLGQGGQLGLFLGGEGSGAVEDVDAAGAAEGLEVGVVVEAVLGQVLAALDDGLVGVGVDPDVAALAC